MGKRSPQMTSIQSAFTERSDYLHSAWMGHAGNQDLCDLDRIHSNLLSFASQQLISTVPPEEEDADKVH